MPLFLCTKCGCLENTALGDYWCKEKPLCSECGFGKWHGEFKKRVPKKEEYEYEEDSNL